MRHINNKNKNTIVAKVRACSPAAAMSRSPLFFLKMCLGWSDDKTKSDTEQQRREKKKQTNNEPTNLRNDVSRHLGELFAQFGDFDERLKRVHGRLGIVAIALQLLAAVCTRSRVVFLGNVRAAALHRTTLVRPRARRPHPLAPQHWRAFVQQQKRQNRRAPRARSARQVRANRARVWQQRRRRPSARPPDRRLLARCPPAHPPARARRRTE